MNPGKTNPEKTIVKDPVCNMDVDPAMAAGSSEYKGQTYYFCSLGCVKRFNADPEKYLAPRPSISQPSGSQMVQIGGIIPAPAAALPIAKPAQDQSAGKGTVTYVCPMDPEVRESKPGACPKCGMALEPEAVDYTCPMHPEIVRDRPGNCPICGMALEPRFAAGVHEDDDSELRSMQRRFWVGVALSIPCWRSPWAAWPPAAPCTTCLRDGWNGCNSRSPHPSCFGEAGRSFSAAGRRW